MASIAVDCVLEKRDFEGIDRLLAAGVDINAVFSGLTMMQAAIKRKDQEMVKWLVARGADVNRPAPRCFPPLFCALVMNDVPMMELLLELGADANQCWSGKDLLTELACNTCEDPKSKMIELLVRHGALIDGPEPRRGMTPLDIAARWVSEWDVPECSLRSNAVVQTFLSLGACRPHYIKIADLPTEDEAHEVRWRVYFRESMVQKLLKAC